MTSTIDLTKRKLALAVSCVLAGTMFSVQAQDEQEGEEEEAEERVERIQVVGSRIRTDGLDSASPVEIISGEIAEEQGLNTLGELLRTATIASGSDQLTSALSVGFVTQGGAGTESISMRGLGANRTLVLLNGRRAGPAGTRGEVSAFDLNSIPVSAVERVEILKDGASSLYGSDAVAGVINIITKKGDEKSVSFNGSLPEESGGENYRANATWGTSFDGGSVRVVADYRLQTELARGDRDHFDCSERYYFDPATGERVDPIDPRTGEFHCNDLTYGMWLWDAGAGNFTSRVTSYDYSGFHAENGSPTYEPVNPGDIDAPDGWYPVGYSKETDGWSDSTHPFQNLESMVPESELASVYFLADYDLGSTTTFYTEALYSRRETTINSYRQFWEPFIPAWAGLVPGWDGWVYLDPTSVTDHSGSVTTIDYGRFVAGLEGSIGYWDWDVSYQRSVNSGVYETKIIHRDGLEMAHDAIWGDPCEGLTTPISGVPCYEIPFFTPEYLYGDHDAQTRELLFGWDQGKTIYKQDTLDAYITGDIFDLSHGSIAGAFGLSYQTDEIKDTPGMNTLAGNSWGMTSAGITEGNSETSAIYGEIRVPLLRDAFMADFLDITASARYTDVSTYGDDTTYKLSANWGINDNWRVRASRGTSFRAPALFELFLQEQTSFFDQRTDPCWDWGAGVDDGTINPTVAQNCAADGIPDDYANDFGSGTAVTSGGAGVLEAETSTSEGLGIIFTSDSGDFAASIDYYEVEILDQVSNVGGASILNLCYSSENFETEPFCDMFTRNDGTGGNYGIDEVFGGYVNVARQFVRGADIRITYDMDTDFGDIRVRLDHTAQIERSFKQFPDSDEIQYVGRLGNPKHSGTLNTTLTRDSWSFNWAVNYYDSVSNYHLYDNGNITTYRGEEVRFVAHADFTHYHSFSVNKAFESGFDITLGLANAFDKKPPRMSPAAARTVGNAALYSQYDNYGRRLFLNASYTF